MTFMCIACRAPAVHFYVEFKMGWCFCPEHDTAFGVQTNRVLSEAEYLLRSVMDDWD